MPPGRGASGSRQLPPLQAQPLAQQLPGVQRALERLDCSLLSVAHRLATIKACDRIYVMESGGVVEAGTHAELVERGGVYAGMVERQSFGD